MTRPGSTVGRWSGGRSPIPDGAASIRCADGTKAARSWGVARVAEREVGGAPTIPAEPSSSGRRSFGTTTYRTRIFFTTAQKAGSGARSGILAPL